MPEEEQAPIEEPSNKANGPSASIKKSGLFLSSWWSLYTSGLAFTLRKRK